MRVIPQREERGYCPSILSTPPTESPQLQQRLTWERRASTAHRGGGDAFISWQRCSSERTTTHDRYTLCQLHGSTWNAISEWNMPNSVKTSDHTEMPNQRGRWLNLFVSLLNSQIQQGSWELSFGTENQNRTEHFSIKSRSTHDEEIVLTNIRIIINTSDLPCKHGSGLRWS